MAPMGGMPGGMPNVDDIKAMEAEIDNFVRNLPVEQQKQFYKDVEELTGIMEKMSPDELNDFVGSVFSEAGLTETPKPPTAPQPATTTPAQEEKPKPAETKPAVVIMTAPSGPTEKALAMLDAIIDRTEEFMLKAQIIPELPGKMNKWVVQKKLTEVSAKIDWSTLETQIDAFKILLYELKETDPKTGVYRHIGNLIKDEALYNNLATLQVTLDAYVPQVYVPDFGLDMVSKESREAIRHVISQYLELFYLLKAPDAIKKILQAYESRAKELTEEEKKFAEKAKQDIEKPRRAAPGEKTPGTPVTPSQTYMPSPYEYDYSGGYGGYTPSYTPYSSYEPAPEPFGEGSAFGKYAGGKPTGGTKKKAAQGEEGEEKEGKGKDEKGKGGKEEKSKEKSPAFAKDDTAEYKMRRAIEKAEEIIDPLKEFDKIFPNFKDHFDTSNFDDTFINDKLKDLVNTIEMNNIQLKKTISDIKSFKKSLDKLNKPTKDHYKKELSKGLKDAIKFYKELHENILEVKDLLNIPIFKSKFSKDKLYVYFGEGTPSAAVLDKVPTVPVTMEQLDKTIQDFMKEVK